METITYPHNHPRAATLLQLACLLSLLSTLIAGSSPAAAETLGSRWSFEMGGVWMTPGGDAAEAAIPEGEARFSASDGSGFGIGLEYRIAPRWGIEVSARFTDLDTEFQVETIGGMLRDTDTMGFELFGVGANYYLPLGADRYSLRLGGAVIQSKAADQTFLTETGGRSKLTFDDDIGFELAAGFDISLGAFRTWLIRAQFSYLQTILESDSDFRDMDLDPVMVSFGLAHRF